MSCELYCQIVEMEHQWMTLTQQTVARYSSPVHGVSTISPRLGVPDRYHVSEFPLFRFRARFQTAICTQSTHSISQVQY